MIARQLIDYYRCPEDMLRMSLAGDLSADEGFFRVGPNICYGRSSSGVRAPRPSGRLHDVLPAVVAEGSLLRVPFDPSEIADNLRRERYTGGPYGAQARRSWQRPYYVLRRFMPDALRRALQRTYLRDWRTHSFPHWPVDSTVDQIFEQLVLCSLRGSGRTRLPFVWFWPEGAPSCVIVTHDVETSAGQDRCSWLMDLDDSYGIKSAFQIVPEERYPVSSAFLEGIRDRGFEINVHDLNHDGRLFIERDEFVRRAQRINQYVRDFGARGFRSGALYRKPDWYDALEIDYDMSIPNAGHLEIQRGGCCTVMPYFIGDIVELPLTTTQDYSLTHILRDFSNEVWKSQMESIMGRHGLVSFIVHPDYLDVDRAREVYRMLLDHVSSLREAGQCWLALPGEVERWWRQRSRMTLVPEGDRWRIEGEGSERARVAYAVLDGDSLTYSIDLATPNREGTSVA